MRPIALAVSLLWSVTTVAAADTRTISGRVLVAGKPLEHAALRVTSAGGAGQTINAERSSLAEVIVRTDAQGRFVLPVPADADFLSIEAAAPGSTTEMIRQPAARSKPLDIDLKPADTATIGEPLGCLIVYPDGSPAPFAVVRKCKLDRRMKREGYSGLISSYGGSTPPGELFVADSGGRVTLRVNAGGPNTTLAGVTLRCTVDGYSDTAIDIDPSQPDPKLVLKRDTTVTGRVVRDGKPVAGASVFVGPVDALIGPPRTEQTAVKTDKDGRFIFDRAWPGVPLLAFVLSSPSQATPGSDPVSIFPLPESSSKDIGDLAILTPTRLSGTVSIENAPPLPDLSRICVQYQPTGQKTFAPIDEHGHFEIPNLPANGPCLIFVDGPSTIFDTHMLSPRNRSIYPNQRLTLAGTLDAGKHEVRILVIKFAPPAPANRVPLEERPFQSINPAEAPGNG